MLFKLLVFLSLAVLPVSLFAVRQVIPFEDIDNKIEKNRDLVEDVYYRLMKEHYFDDASNPEMIYSNNMILSTNLDDDPVEKGTVLLNLIVWLEQKNDAESRLLLRKINRLYFLEFHRAISILDPKSNPDKTLLFSTFHELSRHRSFHPSLGHDYPFRTAITKAVLTLFVINKTVVPITKKRESALYSLEKIKQEMIFINKTLGQNGINEGTIYHFISGLEKFGVIETLVESKFFRNFVIVSLVVITVVFIIWKWDVIGAGLGKLGVYSKKVIDTATADVGNKFGKGLVESVFADEEVKKIRKNIEVQGAEAKKDIQGIRDDVTALRNETESTTEKAIRGMLRGMVRPETQAPAGDANPPGANVPPPPPAGGANPPGANVPPQAPPPQGGPAGNGVPQDQAINPDLQALTDVIVGGAVNRICDRVQNSRAGSWFMGPRSEQDQQQGGQQQPPEDGSQGAQNSSFWNFFDGMSG